MFVLSQIPENQTLVLYREQRKAQEDAQVLRECDRWDRLVWMILEHKNGHGPPDCDCSGCRLWHVLQEDEAVNDQVSEGSSGDGSSDGFVSLEHEQEEMRPMTQTHKGSDTPYSRGGMPSRIGDLPSGSGDPGEGSESDGKMLPLDRPWWGPLRRRNGVQIFRRR